jgi:hypothetical protein
MLQPPEIGFKDCHDGGKLDEPAFRSPWSLSDMSCIGAQVANYVERQRTGNKPPLALRAKELHALAPVGQACSLPYCRQTGSLPYARQGVELFSHAITIT